MTFGKWPRGVGGGGGGAQGGSFTPPVVGFVDPAILYGAILAYRAEDAVVNAGVIDQLNPFMGSLVALPFGAKKGQPVLDALMGNAVVIPSVAGSLGYGAAHTPPAAQTVIAAWRYTTGDHSVFCQTTNGGVNTGQSMFKAGAPQAFVHATSGPTDANQTVGIPDVASVITVGTWTTGGKSSIRWNSVTPVLSPVDLPAMGGNRLHLMDVGSGLYGIGGSFGTLALFDRVLTNNEIGYAMAYYGNKYGIAVVGAPPLA